MKKTTYRILASALTLILLTAVLASCATKLSGTYESDAFLGIKSVYTFDGDKVTVSLNGSLETDGTYTIDGDKITIKFGSRSTEYDFSRDGDTITIDGTKYTKQK